MKIRSVRGTVSEIKQLDEMTAINETMLKLMIGNGEILSENVGNKIIVDADAVIKVLCEKTGCKDGTVPHIRTIRDAVTEHKTLCKSLGLSQDRIRECVMAEFVPSIRIGNRNYIATEAFQEPMVNAFFSHDRKSKRMKKTVSQCVAEQISSMITEKTEIKVFRRA